MRVWTESFGILDDEPGLASETTRGGKSTSHLTPKFLAIFCWASSAQTTDVPRKMLRYLEATNRGGV
jgi:hypothetical protein